VKIDASRWKKYKCMPPMLRMSTLFLRGPFHPDGRGSLQNFSIVQSRGPWSKTGLQLPPRWRCMLVKMMLVFQSHRARS
jgi:hypothetical protein